MKEKIKRITIEFITSPINLILYWILCYGLTDLCMYGRYNNNIYIFLIPLVLFIFIIIFYIIRINKSTERKLKLLNSKIWKCISLIIILTITLFYGVKIYKSATNYGGKLSWVIKRVENERSLDFNNNNIYQYGVKGIFEDINKKYKLPEKLYLLNDLNIKFEKDGTITYFEAFVYGKDKNEKEETYLIYYDKNKSKDIKLILNGIANSDYSNDKLLDPLFETAELISLKDTVSKWNGNEFGLLYKGKVNWEGNREGIVVINKNGEEIPLNLLEGKLVGYPVSIYIPNKEEVVPVRYNLLTDSYWFKYLNTDEEDIKNENQQEWNVIKGDSGVKDEFYLYDGVRYKLNIDDKASGSFFYSLHKTNDGGNNWFVINENPFNGLSGEAYGIYFIDENIGFIGISRNGGCEGDLYRTEDGGKSFSKVEFEEKMVTGDNGVSIMPFDYPSIPYEKDGKHYVNIGQGADGDYDGNSSLIYSSNDNGRTWEYIEKTDKTNMEE
ncbi:WD40/YVTN/BNR-like repeat-containing protein [Clostridium sp.]|uniref:WD40/YVTN/BNR-like repeat-containing protein n=1 Tax=Clostridium sp. TaxID=1506 RepID=UPI003F31B573